MAILETNDAAVRRVFMAESLIVADELDTHANLFLPARAAARRQIATGMREIVEMMREEDYAESRRLTREQTFEQLGTKVSLTVLGFLIAIGIAVAGGVLNWVLPW